MISQQQGGFAWPGKPSGALHTRRYPACDAGMTTLLVVAGRYTHFDSVARMPQVRGTAILGEWVLRFLFGGSVRGRNLLSIAELSADEVDLILRTALSLKRDGGGHALLEHKTLALIFEKPSLRTRVSFDVAMQELGGTPSI